MRERKEKEKQTKEIETQITKNVGHQVQKKRRTYQTETQTHSNPMFNIKSREREKTIERYKVPLSTIWRFEQYYVLIKN